ncbi:hypothetical protein CC85DRAFT_263927 [Cutaneotrichosporon oleaginosum]|uniref:PAS domain-containing protein n=1 Tax=Cutaneotrichosporon oleaginosum TaxID=879819 RepID=A0A0J0XH26_9TREE|nr:uncharacterized protein CC85DRAFT_263927 [Cutaneotrichosporon oleaginosum]KLT40358.1 hypothetical protein CC85DRAFT_263927 [Cutaneotrichosporon oleaginosum]TXT06479.1 hypothetical protein COLE_05810 [Cutaneotrichosporon oleaginosum]
MADPPTPPLARELGLSALFVLTGERNAVMVYVSESIAEILGYEPGDLVGKTSYLIFHPDEIPLLREIHFFALQHEKVGCIMYMRLLHQRGFYVDCAVTYSTVYDLTVGIVTRAINGPNVIRLAATAREVVEARGGVDGVTMQRWSTPPGSRSPTASPLPPNPRKPWESDWVRAPPSPRTFFLLDRFTDTARIMFASNTLLVDAATDTSFYAVVRPQDRPRVRQWIDAAKLWAPVVYDEERTGGHGYLVFDVMKIPDPPPAGQAEPQGTEESVRVDGQEFISVEGIFTASSDGIAAIITPVTD